MNPQGMDWHNSPYHNTFVPPVTTGGPFEVPAMANAFYGIPNRGANTYASYLTGHKKLVYKAKRFLHWWLFEDGNLEF